MAKIISIANQKGGVGKTTTTINLCANLARIGQKVLVIDLDPQANCSTGLGFDKKSSSADVYDVIMKQVKPKQGIRKTKIKNLYLMPSTLNLAGATVELVELKDREYIMKNILKELLSHENDPYNYIFIDCPPSLGVLTLNALTASQTILIPIQTEFFALEGLSLLMQTIKMVQENLNPALQIEGVLLTMLDHRTRLTDDVIKEVIAYFKKKVYKTMIPRNVRLAEAPSYGEPITLYDANCVGNKAYFSLANEFLELNN